MQRLELQAGRKNPRPSKSERWNKASKSTFDGQILNKISRALETAHPPLHRVSHRRYKGAMNYYELASGDKIAENSDIAGQFESGSRGQ